MHILVTNDDGPPSPQSSPYVRCLVKHLQDAGHVVSVCLPHTQRSWIGKAHMIGQTLRPTYYRPSANIHGEESQGTTHHRPSESGDADEWVLIDGTPASCVQIGLHHFFKDRGPVDLVLSGPNYGRNTTAVFALSSGTLGAALEAAVCKQRSIALSFAFFSRNHDPVIIEAACRHSVKVISAIYQQWPTDGSADLYSVNVPLVEGVEKNKTLFTEMLQNYWREGSCFQVIDAEVGDEKHDEEMIREGEGGEVDGKDRPPTARRGHAHKHFKWAPKFADVYKSVEEAGPGNDGWAVKEGQTSVTPLKANFASGLSTGEQKELKLSEEQDSKHTVKNLAGTVEAVVCYGDNYVQPLIKSALDRVFLPNTLKIVEGVSDAAEDLPIPKLLSSPESRSFQICAYEAIDFEFAASHPRTFLINSYMIRKAVIRKHYLSTTVEHWVAKNPSSVLQQHFKRSEAFEVDYAEFLDDALVEAFDLRESLDRNSLVAQESASERQWWILKPGMSDRGQGIKLFSTMEELQEIFDTWEAERPDSDDEADSNADDATAQNAEDTEEGGDYITTSHLRHFVAQPYIHPPLLLDNDGRKFHIRTYVLCSGSLNIYVYKPMLALFAAKPYSPPWEATDDIETFLTNTCLQDSPNENSVQRFWELPLPQTKLQGTFRQICAVTGEVFEAAARAMPIHFQTLPNAFEVFGLDFLLDDQGAPWLLEINAFPDFRQTGADLQDIVAGFWEGVLRCAVAPFFGLEDRLARRTGAGDGDAAEEGMVLVRKLDLGRN